jgi:dTDP-4-dehydrorhamnose reductase
MRIGITGASGMLGTALLSQISKSQEVFATSRNVGIQNKNIKWDCFDLTNFKFLERWLDKIKPNLVIHCAAIVDVNFCEENLDLATALHVKTTKLITKYINFYNGRLIYISTDSVFDGNKKNSYKETDIVNPLNIYAKTKLQGEKFVQSISNGLVLRTSIIGLRQNRYNSFAEWILQKLIQDSSLDLFHDVYFSPISVQELSVIIDKIIQKPIYGLYHCGSSDSISKYEFGKKMSEIFQLSDSKINKVSIDSLNFKAKRPKNMSLNISKIKSDLIHDISDVQTTIKFLKNNYVKI